MRTRYNDIKDFRRVNVKTNLLFQMADVAFNNLDGIIKQVLFPVVNENTLKVLVKEFKSTGAQYRQKVYTVMRASYSSHYRRMVPELLNILISFNFAQTMMFTSQL